MEITEEKIKELNMSQDIFVKCEIVRNIFERASNNPKLNKYFNSDTLNGLFSSVIICKTEEKYRENYLNGLTKKDREQITELDIPLAFTNSETNKIYIKLDTPIDVITHEIVHHISNKQKKETGIYGVMKGYYSKFGIENPAKKMEVDSLNEAITHYITQLLIPEIKISDGYNYGSEVINKYAKISAECGKDANKILDSYFNGNQKSFDSIVTDFGINFEKVLESINVSRFMTYYRGVKNPMSNEEIDNILNNMRIEIDERNTNNLNIYNNVRKIYSDTEQKKYLKI